MNIALEKKRNAMYESSLQGQIVSQAAERDRIKFAQDQAFMQSLSSAKDIGTFMNAMKTRFPVQFLQYEINEKEKNAMLDALARGDIQTGRALGYTGPETPQEATARLSAGEDVYMEYAPKKQEIALEGVKEEERIKYGYDIALERERQRLKNKYETENMNRLVDSEWDQWVRKQIWMKREGTQISEATKRMHKLNEIPGILSSVKKLYLDLDPGEGMGEKAQKWAERALGKLGATGEQYEKAAAYDYTMKSIAVLLARSLGDVGNISVIEREINEKMLPTVTDVKEVGLRKINNFNTIVSAMRNNHYETIKDILRKEKVNFSEGGYVQDPEYAEYDIFQPKTEEELIDDEVDSLAKKGVGIVFGGEK